MKLLFSEAKKRSINDAVLRDGQDIGLRHLNERPATNTPAERQC